MKNKKPRRHPAKEKRKAVMFDEAEKKTLKGFWDRYLESLKKEGK